jgi:mRNA interferase HigB
MRLVGRDKLDRFCTEHADCRKWIAAWIADVESARWRTPQDIKQRYASASMLERNTVIFNVRGNEYRLVTVIAYQVGVVAVEWIGTHAEYSKRH